MGGRSEDPAAAGVAAGPLHQDLRGAAADGQRSGRRGRGRHRLLLRVRDFIQVDFQIQIQNFLFRQTAYFHFSRITCNYSVYYDISAI